MEGFLGLKSLKKYIYIFVLSKKSFKFQIWFGENLYRSCVFVDGKVMLLSNIAAMEITAKHCCSTSG